VSEPLSQTAPQAFLRDRVCRWLAIGLLAAFTTTSSGGFETSDTVLRYMTAKSWLAGQQGQLPREQGWNVGAISPVDGRVFTFYGPLQSLLMVPILVALEAVPVQGDRSVLETFAISLLLFPLISTFALVVLYRALRWLGYEQAESLLAVLGLGLGSLFWHYARMGQEENLIGLAIATWLLGAAKLRVAGEHSCLLMALGAVIALCTRWAALPLLAVLFTATVLLLWRYRAHVQGGDLAAAGAVVVLATGALLYFNYSRFGRPLETGYGLWYRAQDMKMFQLDNYGRNLAALLVSPYRGLLVYSPVVMLAFAGALLPSRGTSRLLGLTGVVACATLVLFTASFHFWSGGHSWGPRFLAGVQLALAPGLANTLRRWPRSVLLFLVLVPLQLVSTMLPASTEEYVWYNAERSQPGTCSAWQPSCTAVGQRIPRALAAVRNTLMNEPGTALSGRPIVAPEIVLTTSDYRTLYWWPVRIAFRLRRFPAWVALAACAIGLAVAAFALARAWSAARLNDSPTVQMPTRVAPV